MGKELYFIIPIVVLGLILSSRIKRKQKDRQNMISWYNHLLEQYINLYQNVAEQYDEKLALAENYNDRDSLKRLHKLYDDTVRTAENIEKKLESLKAIIAGKKFHRASFAALLNDLMLVESYVAELANIAHLIRSIHPSARNNHHSFENEDYSYDTEEKSKDKPWKSSRFFASCNTKEELAKKFRELAKIYHPDNVKTGNADIFKKVKVEYDKYIN